MSNLGENFPMAQSLSEVPVPVHRQNSASLEDMLTALVDEGRQARNEPARPIDRLQHENASLIERLQANQLRSYVPAPLAHDDLLSQTLPCVPSGRLKSSPGVDVGLQDLVEREIKAARELEERKSQNIERSSQYRSQSVAPSGITLARGITAERVGSPWERVDSLLAKVNELQKEMEKMDEALQHSTEENSRLATEKAVCVEAHERDVASLENMLTSIMSENKTLKEALVVAMEKNPPKLRPSGVPDDVERLMISTLIENGISNTPSTPTMSQSTGSGSVSTETPPSTEDWEECDRLRNPATIPRWLRVVMGLMLMAARRPLDDE